MATFVLVHGAWHGGWCWKRVAALLRRAGHEVFTPTLTGLGERAHLMSDAIDLHTHIQDILGVLQWEELADVVLCGHSYGGMVISGVPTACRRSSARSCTWMPLCRRTAPV
jgi:pimeloyl-ACP methyl ester carboxylesterase